MSVRKGHFIVVEGLEGAGKSTALEAIKHKLHAEGIHFVLTREPGGTQVGDSVRRLTKECSDNEPLDSRAELLLFYAARVQLMTCVIRPKLAQGIWVLSDRFELSTFAYQGGGRKLDADMISHLSAFCLEGFEPDLTLFLDVNPSLGLERVDKRGAMDRIEQESLAFFNDVSDCYHEHIKNRSNVVLIDANQSLSHVEEHIQIALSEYINQTMKT
jgi:dTMP kinase